MIGLLNYDYYEFMFQQLPSQAIMGRYLGSVALRGIFIVLAIGLLMNKELARRTLIITSLLNLTMVSVKHPAAVFNNIAIYKEVQQGQNQFPAGTATKDVLYPIYPPSVTNYPLQFPQIPKISRISFIVIDAVFSLILIVYFTRPPVRRYFRHEP